MTKKVLSACVRLRADGTFVGPLSSVQFHVASTRNFGGEAIVADGTLERLLVEMRNNVVLQTSLGGEPVLAHIALVGTFTSMLTEMDLVGEVVRRGVITRVALVWTAGAFGSRRGHDSVSSAIIMIVEAFISFTFEGVHCGALFGLFFDFRRRRGQRRGKWQMDIIVDMGVVKVRIVVRRKGLLREIHVHSGGRDSARVIIRNAGHYI